MPLRVSTRRPSTKRPRCFGGGYASDRSLHKQAAHGLADAVDLAAKVASGGGEAVICVFVCSFRLWFAPYQYVVEVRLFTARITTRCFPCSTLKKMRQVPTLRHNRSPSPFRNLTSPLYGSARIASSALLMRRRSSREGSL